MTVNNLTTWDINETNMAQPSASLVSDGYTQDAIPTSANINYILHWLSANRIPVGTIQPMMCSAANAPYGWLPATGSGVGSSQSTADFHGDEYEALFIWIWENWAQAVVTPSKGASAQDDWDANKKISLYNLIGHVPVGQNTAPGSAFATRGVSVGHETHTLTVAEMAEHHHIYERATSSVQVSTDDEEVFSTSENAQTGSTGGGKAHNNVQPSLVCNYFIKW